MKNDHVKNSFYDIFNSGNKNSLTLNNLQQKNIVVEQMFRRVLTETALNRFTWNGLPDGIDKRWLELLLLNHGSALFYRYESLEYGDRFLVSQFTGQGNVNHYNNPTVFRPVAIGGLEQRNYDVSNAVPVWSNYLRSSETDIIQLYAHRLQRVDTSIDVNIVNSRNTRVLVIPEEAKMTMMNIDRQVNEGVPTIKVSPHVNVDEIYSSIDLGYDRDVLPELMAAKGKLWNEALMLLGVPTVNQDKKERMITGEAETGKDQAETIRESALKSRVEACENINRLFGLDVSVEWHGKSDEEMIPQLFDEEVSL